MGSAGQFPRGAQSGARHQLCLVVAVFRHGHGPPWGDIYRTRSSYAPGLTTNFAFSERDAFGVETGQLAWIAKFGAEYLRVRPYLTEDFYPLTSGVSGDDAWCAVQYHRSAQGMEFSKPSGARFRPIPPRALRCAACRRKKRIALKMRIPAKSFACRAMRSCARGFQWKFWSAARPGCFSTVRRNRNERKIRLAIAWHATASLGL